MPSVLFDPTFLFFVFLVRSLENGADIVVGTCGRIQDMLERKSLKLDRCKFVILDEADEMLNIGFADDVETILSNLNKEENSTNLVMVSNFTSMD